MPGYEGQAAFCRTFHRHFGMSLTRYRRDTPGKESNLQYPLRVGMEIEQRGGLPPQRQTGISEWFSVS